MRLERLNNLPLNTVTPNFVAIFVFFGTASSFIEIISSSETEANREAILFLFSCSEVNSTRLITSELANQCAWRVLFTCVVYTNTRYCAIKAIDQNKWFKTPHDFLTQETERQTLPFDKWFLDWKRKHNEEGKMFGTRVWTPGSSHKRFLHSATHASVNQKEEKY